MQGVLLCEKQFSMAFIFREAFGSRGRRKTSFTGASPVCFWFWFVNDLVQGKIYRKHQQTMFFSHEIWKVPVHFPYSTSPMNVEVSISGQFVCSPSGRLRSAPGRVSSKWDSLCSPAPGLAFFHDLQVYGTTRKKWICMSENVLYPQWNSHLIGIMIINHWVLGYTIFRQTHMDDNGW